MNKQQLTQERKAQKRPPLSEEKAFLTNLLNNTRGEITKINGYLGGLNHNMKIIKKLLSEVK